MRLAIVAVAMSALVGCSTTLTRLPATEMPSSSDVRPLEVVEISNACLLLLSFLPIASGDPQSPNSGGSCWFEDTTTVANQMRMLETEASRIGATRAIDMKTLRVVDASPFLFLLQREKIHTSAVLVRDIPRPAKNGKEKMK